jgi:hypothetical protein
VAEDLGVARPFTCSSGDAASAAAALAPDRRRLRPLCAAVRGQRGDRRGGLLCPRVLYVRRSELKEISPDAVDVSSFDEAKRVASVAEEERRIIEAERRRLGLDV